MKKFSVFLVILFSFAFVFAACDNGSTNGGGGGGVGDISGNGSTSLTVADGDVYLETELGGKILFSLAGPGFTYTFDTICIQRGDSGVDFVDLGALETVKVVNGKVNINLGTPGPGNMTPILDFWNFNDSQEAIDAGFDINPDDTELFFTIGFYSSTDDIYLLCMNYDNENEIISYMGFGYVDKALVIKGSINNGSILGDWDFNVSKYWNKVFIDMIYDPVTDKTEQNYYTGSPKYQGLKWVLADVFLSY